MSNFSDVLARRLGNTNTYEFAPSGAGLAIDDDAFHIEDPADNTKRVRFDAGALATATTNVITLADGAGLLPVHQVTRADAVVSLGNTTSATNMFASTGDALTVLAGVTYRFRLVYRATTGATATTLSFLLAGTATFTTVDYMSLAVDAASGTAAAALMNNGEVATAVVVGASGTGVIKRIWIEGEFEVNAAGTVIPQIKFSADPTGTCETMVGSFMEVWPLGTNPVLSYGAWG
jgi:hypothetical protein